MDNKPNKGPIKITNQTVKKTVEVVTHVNWTELFAVNKKEYDAAEVRGFSMELSPIEKWRAEKFCELHSHSEIYNLESHISIRIKQYSSFGCCKYCYCDFCHVEAEITDIDEWL